MIIFGFGPNKLFDSNTLGLILVYGRFSLFSLHSAEQTSTTVIYRLIDNKKMKLFAAWRDGLL